MNVISEEYMEVDNGLSTYVIVIPNFRKKLREANVGEVVSTKKFMIQESMFTIDLYIAGDEINSWGHLSLFLTNESEQNNQKQLEALEQVFQGKLLALEQRLASQTAELSDVKAKLLNVETGIITAKDNHKRAIIPEVESKNNSSQRIPFNILCFR